MIMKKALLLFLNIYIFLTIAPVQAQTLSEKDISFLKQMRKSMYKKFYSPDSLISKTTDPSTLLTWQSKTFKNSAAILDTLERNMEMSKSSEGLSGYALFPKGIPQEDCNLFTSKLISYELLNEKEEKVELRTDRVYSGIGKYYRNSTFVACTFDIKFPPVVPAKTYKGLIQFDITAPKDFNVVTITKADIGNKITINTKTYTVLAFTKNYIALKSDTVIKEINFDFLGTNAANKKYQFKYTQEQGYRTALGRASFILSEKMYTYFTTHPKLSDQQLNDYLTEYFTDHVDSLILNEAEVLVICDIAYIEKMFCYWPNTSVTKRIKEVIDVKY